MFLLAIRKEERGVVNTIVVNAVAKALTFKNVDASLKAIDTDSSFQEKSLLKKWVSQACIYYRKNGDLNGARKEAAFSP